MSPSPIAVAVVSDVVCPWCYLGKRRLARALDLLPEIAVSVRWLPFRLDPTIPPQGIDREAYLNGKFGSVEAVRGAHQQLVERGRAEGIDFRFDLIRRSPNTVDAHRLIRWAAAGGVEDEMVERLFAAYFSQGRDVGDAEVLTQLAAAAGLDGADIKARLAAETDRAEVAAEIDNAYRAGIDAVPCFIIDQRYAVMGAHPPEQIAKVIAEVAAAAGEPAAPAPM
ncbi:MAG: DsbA family oxidoreductase [Bauldia sp.]